MHAILLLFQKRLKPAQHIPRTGLRHHDNRTEIEYFSGADLGNFPGKLFGLFGRFQYFQVRNFYHEPHTASLPALEKLEAGWPELPTRLHVYIRTGQLVLESQEFDTGICVDIQIVLDVEDRAAYVSTGLGSRFEAVRWRETFL